MLYIIGLPKELRNILPLALKETPIRLEPLRRIYWDGLRKYFKQIEIECPVMARGKPHMKLYRACFDVEALRYDFDSAYPTLLIKILEEGRIYVDDNFKIRYPFRPRALQYITVEAPGELLKIIKTILQYKAWKKHYVLLISTRGRVIDTQFSMAVKPGLLEKHGFDTNLYLEAESQEPFNEVEVIEYTKKIPYTVHIIRLTDFVKYGLLVLIGYLARKAELATIHYAIIDYCYDCLEALRLKCVEKGFEIYYTYVDCICLKTSPSELPEAPLRAKVEDYYEHSDVWLPPLFKMKNKHGLWLIGTEDSFEFDRRIEVWNRALQLGRMVDKAEWKKIMYPTALQFLKTRNLGLLQRTGRALLNTLQKLNIMVKLEGQKVKNIKFEGEIDWARIRERSKEAWSKEFQHIGERRK